MAERYVPPLPGAVVQTYWYCLDCGKSCVTTTEAIGHWRATHAQDKDDMPTQGVDYALGSQYILMRFRYEKWIESEAARFMADMHPGFGPEDFVAECEIRE